MLVAELGAGPDDVGRAGQRREVAAARDVVVVEMRLDDVADPQIRVARRVEVDVDVAARVDDRRDARRLIGDERREMAEPLDPVLRDAHGRSLHRGRDRPADRGGAAGGSGRTGTLRHDGSFEPTGQRHRRPATSDW